MSEYAFIDLLNSDWHDYRGSGQTEDRLDSPEWVSDFQRQWGFATARPPGAADLREAKALRSLLRRMVDDLVAGDEPAAKDLRQLNEVLAASPLEQRLERSGDGYLIQQVPAKRSWDWVLAAIAASFATVLAYEDRWRLKVCDNPDCGWVFYDDSRNRSRRWCEDATCGNLMKVRRFRERARQQKRD